MTTPQQDAAYAVADAVANRLASPAHVDSVHHKDGWSRQSLASGAVGVALLHIERARAGRGSWRRAHDWLAYATDTALNCSAESHLYYGAPALAFALHGAADRPGRYARALDALDRSIAAMTRRRLDRAHARIDDGELPVLAEFDAIRGLTGFGIHLLRRDPDGELVRSVLTYLVRLTDPIKDGVTGNGELLPGWWSGLAPSGRLSNDFPGGHANNGLAHGIAGPLALVSLATRHGVRVHGQADAAGRICAWLDQWRQDSDAGTWWPYWITRAELRDGELGPSRPLRPSRPSWCYGTAGLARAQQLAAIAFDDTNRQRMAENALLRALTDPTQLDTTTDLSLCHGHAGLLQVATRAVADASTRELDTCLPALLNRIAPNPDADYEFAGEADAGVGGPVVSLLRRSSGDITFLDGAAGVALALQTAAAGTPPVSGWDSCLLIN